MSTYWHKVLGFYRDFLPQESKDETEGIWTGLEEVVKDRLSRISISESALKLDGANGYKTVDYDILDMSSFDYSVSTDMTLADDLFPFDELVSAVGSDSPTTFTRGVDFTISNGVLTWGADPGSYDYLFITQAHYKSQVWIDFYRNWFDFEGDPYDYYAPEYIPHLMRSLLNLTQYGPVQKYQRWALNAMVGVPVSPVAGTVTAKDNYTSVDGSTIRQISIRDAAGTGYYIYTKMASADLLATDTVVEQWEPLSVKTTGWDHVELKPYIDKIRTDNHLFYLDDDGTTNLTEGLVGVWASDDPTALTKNGDTLEIASDGSTIYVENDNSIALPYGYYEWLVKFKADDVPDFTMRIYDDTTALDLYDDRKICSRFMNSELFGPGRFYDQYIRFDMDSSSWTASTSLITTEYSRGLLGIYFPNQAGYIENTIGGLDTNATKSLYFSAYVDGLFKISVLKLDNTVITSKTFTASGEYVMKRILITTPSDSSYVKVRLERVTASVATIPNNDFSSWTNAYAPASWTIANSLTDVISKQGSSTIRFDGRARGKIYAQLSATMTTGGVYRIDTVDSHDSGAVLRYFLSAAAGGTTQEVRPGIGFTASGDHEYLTVLYVGRRNRSIATIDSISLTSTNREIESIELDMALIGEPSDIVRKRFFVDANGIDFVGRITFDGFDGDSDAEFTLEEWKIYELRRQPYLVPVGSISGDEIYIADQPGLVGSLDNTGAHQSVEVPHSAELEDLSGTAFTIEAKFQTSTLQEGQIASLDEDGAPIIAIGLDSSGKPKGVAVASGTNTVTGAKAIPPKIPHYLALRYNGTNLELLLDFVVVATTPLAASVATSLTAKLKIGTDGEGRDFVGHIEYVRAWDDYRTDYELRDNRERRITPIDGIALDTTGLIESWEFAIYESDSENSAMTDDAAFTAGEPAGLLDTENAVTISAWIAPRTLFNGVIIGRGDGIAANTTMMFEISQGRLAATLSDGTDIGTFRVPLVHSLLEDNMIPVQLIWSAAGLMNVGDVENNIRIYQDGQLVGIFSDEELGLTMSALPGAPVGTELTIASDNDGNRKLPAMHENYAIYNAVKDDDLANTGDSLFADPDLNNAPNTNIWQPSRTLRMEQNAGADNSYVFTQKLQAADHTSLKDGKVTVLMPATIGEVYKVDLKMNFVDGGSGDVAGPGTVTLQLRGTSIDSALETAGGYQVKDNNTTLFEESILIQATSEVVKLIFDTSTRYGWELHFFKVDAHAVSSAKISLIKSEGPDGDLEDAGVTPTLGTPDAYWPLKTDLNETVGANNLTKTGSGTARVSKAVPGGKTSNLDGVVV